MLSLSQHSSKTTRVVSRFSGKIRYIASFQPSKSLSSHKIFSSPVTPLRLTNPSASFHYSTLLSAPISTSTQAESPINTTTLEQYVDLYNQSVEEPNQFWLSQSRLLDWFTPPTIARQGTLPQSTTWFADGTLNACYNCVDRHALNPEMADKVAIIWESDDGKETK
jgi:hypothetical protein